LAATITGSGWPRSVWGAPAARRVHHQHGQVGLGQRRLGLAPDQPGQLLAVRQVDPARVDQGELATVPVGPDLLAVARDPRLLVHNRLA
jgi:hypothetical protein